MKKEHILGAWTRRDDEGGRRRGQEDIRGREDILLMVRKQGYVAYVM